MYYSLAPWKTTTLHVVHAQRVDGNIGRPLRKILSYKCSTTFVFKVQWGSIQTFGEIHIQIGLNDIGSMSRRNVAPTRMPGAPERVRRAAWCPATLCIRARAFLRLRTFPRPRVHRGVLKPALAMWRVTVHTRSGPARAARAVVRSFCLRPGPFIARAELSHVHPPVRHRLLAELASPLTS
jgi:hypothetical protein